MENQSLQNDAISHEAPNFAPGSPRKRAALDAEHRLQPPPGLRAAGDDDFGGGEGAPPGSGRVDRARCASEGYASPQTLAECAIASAPAINRSLAPHPDRIPMLNWI